MGHTILQLYQSDLITTSSFKSLFGTSFSGSTNLVNLNGVLYFTIGTQLWAYDPSNNSCSSSGSILREVWNSIPGLTVSSIPLDSIAPSNVEFKNSFEGPTNVANLYGDRYKGYICVPVTGNYTFWIASDDDSELWLSTDGLSSNKVKIAYVKGFTNSRQWDKYPSQKSASIPLIAGRKYYIEALHKENYGNDNLAVGWQLPNGVFERPIPGNRLSPFENSPPVVSIFTPDNYQQFDSPANITISGNATDSDGLITKVEFYNGSTKLGEGRTNPYSNFYSFIWNNVLSGTYTITVKAYDNDGAVTTSASVVVFVGSCTASGSILREYWANIPGSTVSAIPVESTPTSTTTISIFEGPTNVANLYGTRYRGFICVPITGNYTFWIASDDDSELWLSNDSHPSNKVRIAYVNGWTYPRTYNKYSSQQSVPIYLVAGRSYYIEALHKEAYGNDNLSVGWKLPNGTLERPIPGVRLSPYPMTTTISSLEKMEYDAPFPSEEELHVRIVPNPTTNGTSLLLIPNSELPINNCAVSIFNAQGNLILKFEKNYDGQASNLMIPIDERFNSGIYIVQIMINDEVAIERLIVE